jgi:hypothetical protein
MIRRTNRWRRLLLAAAAPMFVFASAGPLELHAGGPACEPLSKHHMPLMGHITKQIHANWNRIRTWEGRVEKKQSTLRDERYPPAKTEAIKRPGRP